MKETDYFISIIEPELLRKVLLESSKEIILNLQDYQRLLLIRKNKLEYTDKLKLQIKELMFLMDKLDKLVPDREIKYEKELAGKQEKKKQEQPQEDHLPAFTMIRQAKSKKTGQKQPIQQQAVLQSMQQSPQKKEEGTGIADLNKLEAALKSIEEKLER
ncbi:MAG: hypothetical protein V1743_03615, partial [Nanoarchaeota archaeon]